MNTSNPSTASVIQLDGFWKTQVLRQPMHVAGWALAVRFWRSYALRSLHRQFDPLLILTKL